MKICYCKIFVGKMTEFVTQVDIRLINVNNKMGDINGMIRP